MGAEAGITSFWEGIDDSSRGSTDSIDLIAETGAVAIGLFVSTIISGVADKAVALSITLQQRQITNIYLRVEVTIRNSVTNLALLVGESDREKLHSF